MTSDTVKIGFIIAMILAGMGASYYIGYSDGIDNTRQICNVCKNFTQPLPSERYRTTDGFYVNWVEQNTTHIRSMEGWYNTTSKLIEPSHLKGNVTLSDTPTQYRVVTANPILTPAPQPCPATTGAVCPADTSGLWQP